MELTMEFTVDITGGTYKEVREKLQKHLEEFLKGTKGHRVKASVYPKVEEVTLAGGRSISYWECHVEVYQDIKGLAV